MGIKCCFNQNPLILIRTGAFSPLSELEPAHPNQYMERTQHITSRNSTSPSESVHHLLREHQARISFGTSALHSEPMHSCSCLEKIDASRPLCGSIPMLRFDCTSYHCRQGHIPDQATLVQQAQVGPCIRPVLYHGWPDCLTLHR